MKPWMNRFAVMIACFAAAIAVILLPQIPSDPDVIELATINADWPGIITVKEGLAIAGGLFTAARFW